MTKAKRDSLFDETPGYEEDVGVRLTKGLNEQEKQQASMLYRLFTGLWGLVIIRGMPGQGKDTFLNWLLYNIKRFFPDKRIWRDEMPRELFGKYAGLFNRETLAGELAEIKAAAKGIAATKIDDVMEKAADKWAESKEAETMLMHSVVGLTEYWKYVYNREPHDPMNKTMGAVHKMARHLDSLVVGCTQLESDLDRKTCKPFVNWRVTCSRPNRYTSRYAFIVEKIAYDTRRDMLEIVSKPLIIPVDAGKPRSFIGDGRIVIKKPDYKPETEEERIVLDVIKAGADNYEELVEFLETEGDMSEIEILETLKDLCLYREDRKPKFVIWYPCYYFIFNSRSLPQIDTRLKVGD